MAANRSGVALLDRHAGLCAVERLVAGRQKTEAPITPTADRQPARLGNFGSHLQGKSLAYTTKPPAARLA